MVQTITATLLLICNKGSSIEATLLQACKKESLIGGEVLQGCEKMYQKGDQRVQRCEVLSHSEIRCCILARRNLRQHIRVRNLATSNIYCRFVVARLRDVIFGGRFMAVSLRRAIADCKHVVA